MAFLGDFGKIFLGGAKTGDVAAAATLALGGDPATAAKVRGTTQAAADVLSGGNDRPDVATAPRQAGVDSAATVLPVSQTGMLMPQQASMAPQQAFIGGAGLGALAQQGIGALGRVLTKPGVGGLIGGLGAGAAAEFVMDSFGNTKKLVITRKLQRDVKKVFMLSGGDIGFISANSLMLFGKDLSEDRDWETLFLHHAAACE